MGARFYATLALTLATSALGAGLEVAPISVTLGSSEQAQLIKLTNSSTEVVRYQLEMKAWSESRAGQMVLSPTQDVIFFPQLLTLKAGESRNVRVGITSAPEARERTYRLFIQELPASDRSDKKSRVQVLTRVGIPIFVAPAQVAPKLELGSVALKGGRVSFGLTNLGNAHARPKTVRLTALDPKGLSIFEKSWDGWYVLAAGTRDYSVQIPPEKCKKAATLRAEVTGESLSLSKTVQADPGDCGS